MKYLLPIFIVLTAINSNADDLTGRLGIGGVFGNATPTGSAWVREKNDTGFALGAWLKYGVCKHLTVGLSYDNLDFDNGPTRLEPLLYTVAVALFPSSPFNPNIHAGVGPGFVRNSPVNKPTVLSSMVGIGFDYFFVRNISVGANVDWFAASRKNKSYFDTNALRSGLSLGLWFGGKAEEKKVVVAAPAPTPAPAPAPKPAPAPAPAPVAAPTPPAPPAKVLPAEHVSISLDIQFDTAQSVVKPQYDEQLKKVADFLKTYTTAAAEIEGHTDNVGKAEYNTDLSQKRAAAVRQALIDRFAADGSRLSAKGYGPDKPIADNNTKEGRAKNRRVVATFSAMKQPAAQ